GALRVCGAGAGPLRARGAGALRVCGAGALRARGAGAEPLLRRSDRSGEAEGRLRGVGAPASGFPRLRGAAEDDGALVEGARWGAGEGRASRPPAEGPERPAEG